MRRLDEDARRTGRISMKEIQEALHEIQHSSEFSNFKLLTFLSVKFCFSTKLTLFLANMKRLPTSFTSEDWVLISVPMLSHSRSNIVRPAVKPGGNSDVKSILI